jgi:hypothetical protein
MPHNYTIPRTCESCGQSFLAENAEVRRGWARFCSVACLTQHRRAEGKRLFWQTMERSGDCLLWTGAKNPGGYGVAFLAEHGTTGAHRMSWILSHGPIPGGLFVLHKCDTPLCCNPDHLFLGTHADNMKDKASKGRSRNRWSGRNVKSEQPS